MNTYGYVKGNPVTWSDAFGLEADMNLFSPSMTNYYHNGFMYQQSKNIPSNNNFQIAGHGSQLNIYNQAGKSISVDDLLKMMKDNGYMEGQTVELMSCNTGKGGVNSFAQKLAEKCNCSVIAPDNYVWYSNTKPFMVAGENADGTPNYNDVGSMNVFEAGSL